MGSSASKDGENGQIHKISASFIWKIEKYSEVPNEKSIRSPNFKIAGLMHFLELHKGTDFEISLNKDAKEKPKEDFPTIRCKISLIDSKGNEGYTRIKEIISKKPKNETEEDKKVSEEQKGEVLLKISKNDNHKLRIYYTQNILTVSFKGTIVSENDGSAVASLRDDTNVLLETLSSDLGNYYESKMNTDILLNVRGSTFPAHRSILSARSTVFAAMFQHDTVEKRKGTVDIPDIDASILEEMLYYIYTGKIREQSVSNAVLLYSAADKYSLNELKEECRKNIIDSLTVENICEAAELADMYQEQTIKNAVVNLVGEKKEEILQSDHWKRFVAEKPFVANNILSSTLIAGC